SDTVEISLDIGSPPFRRWTRPEYWGQPRQIASCTRHSLPPRHLAVTLAFAERHIALVTARGAGDADPGMRLAGEGRQQAGGCIGIDARLPRPGFEQAGRCLRC